MAYTNGKITYKSAITGPSMIPASWRGVVPTGTIDSLTDVNVFDKSGTVETDKSEIGIFEINSFALSVPHNIIPAEYFTQMFVTLRSYRNPKAVSTSDKFGNSAMIFTFKPLLLHPLAFNDTVDALFAKTTDGQIVCYLQNLECSIIRRIYDGIHTKDAHEVGKNDKRYNGTQNKGTLADISSNFIGYSEQQNYDFGLDATSDKRVYSDIKVILHDVVLVQRQDAFSSGNKTMYEGYKLRDARGITVVKLVNNTEQVIYTNRQLQFTVPRDTLNSNLDAQSFVNGEVTSRIDYEWLMRQTLTQDVTGNVPTVFMKNVVQNMIDKVEFTDESNTWSTIDDATVSLQFANTETGELDDDCVTLTSKASSQDAFKIAFTDSNDDETNVTERPVTTQCTLDQCFLSSTIFGEAEYDTTTSIDTHVEFFIDVIVNDYYHTNGGDTQATAQNRTAYNRHRFVGYDANTTEITVSSLTQIIPITYDQISVDRVVQYSHFLLTPVEVVNTFTSDSYGASYKRFNVKSQYVSNDNVVEQLGDFTQDDVDVVLTLYDALTNNAANKDRYVTPMEYYGSSADSTVELFEDDRLSTTASKDEDAPVYFWVETLKNWCTFSSVVNDETSCTEAKLCVWNGVNGWFDFSSLIGFVTQYYTTKEKLKSLDPTNAEDKVVFAKFLLYINFMMSMYNFPLETLHTINIDRVYTPFDPNLKGKGRSFLESVGHTIMTGVRAIKSGIKSAWDCANAVVNVLTLDFKGAYSRWADSWSDLWDMYTGIYTAMYIMPLEGSIEILLDALMNSDPNDEMFKIDYGKQMFARCFYVKLPYDSGYSSNDKTTYQTVRIQHRAEKAYGSIDGGVINRVTCAALNTIPTTIGSPFVTRSSTGELMIAYDMMYSGPVKEKSDSHTDLSKYSGITNLDVELSNQLLSTTLGTGEDKTIQDWLNVFGEVDDYAATVVSDVATTNISTSVVEQNNIVSTACGTLTIKSNRSKVSSDVETTNINTVQKW